MKKTNVYATLTFIKIQKAMVYNSSTQVFPKTVPKALTGVIKILFLYQIESYNNKSQHFSGISSFWTVSKNQPVIKWIDSINKGMPQLSQFHPSFLNFAPKCSS